MADMRFGEAYANIVDYGAKKDPYFEGNAKAIADAVKTGLHVLVPEGEFHVNSQIEFPNDGQRCTFLGSAFIRIKRPPGPSSPGIRITGKHQAFYGMQVTTDAVSPPEPPTSSSMSRFMPVASRTRHRGAGHAAMGALALLVGCQPASVFVQVASDTFYGCGLTSRHHVECWSDFKLQEAEEYNFGQAEPPAGEFAQISVSGSQACGIQVSGALQCWGVEDGGQWDYGQTVSDPGPYTSVSTGFSHSCAISTGGDVRCWGRADDSGFVAPTGEATAVSIGALYECALRVDGEVDCTGNNALTESGPYTALSAGDDHVCALRQEDSVVSCWPYGSAPENYQGFGGETLKLSSIASNAITSSCGLDADGARHCWGWDEGPIGDGPSPEGPYLAVSMAYTWGACMILVDGGIGCVDLGSDVIAAPSASWPSLTAPRYPSD